MAVLWLLAFLGEGLNVEMPNDAKSAMFLMPAGNSRAKLLWAPPPWFPPLIAERAQTPQVYNEESKGAKDDGLGQSLLWLHFFEMEKALKIWAASSRRFSLLGNYRNYAI